MRASSLVGLGLAVSLAAFSLAGARPAAKAKATQDKAALAKQAFAVLNEACVGCHGPDLQSKGLRLDSYAAILKGGESGVSVVPGKPDESLLIKKMLGMGVTLMPPGGPKLADSKINAVRAWIAAGAPDAVTAPVKPVVRAFVSEAQMLAAIRDDLNRAPERSRAYLRYFTLTNLSNAGADDAQIQEYRTGFSKLINSVSWQREISVPTPIDAAKTIFRIDMRKYAWTSATWQKLLALYPYGVQSSSQAAKEIYKITGCDLPYVRADWFVAHAALPPLYHDLLDLPTHVDELEKKLGVDVAKNIVEETVVRAGLLQSGVSRNNRIVERHPSAYGYYWRSYDFGANTGKQNIFKNPLGFEAAGGEIIFSLPNGLQAYFLTDAVGTRIDIGPTNIVDNGKNPNRKPNDPIEVRNGLTCMSCHSEGMRSDFKDNVRAVLQATKASDVTYDHAKALALYVEKDSLDILLKEDRARFKSAVEATGATISGIEPIFALQGAYDSIVTVAQAASDLGLTEAQFVSKLNASSKLAALLGTLKTEGGTIKRDAWEEYFGDTVIEFSLGHYIKPTAVVPVVSPVPPPVVKPNKGNTNGSGGVAGKGKFAAGIARLRSEFTGKKVDALCAYIEAMCAVPAGTMDGKQVGAFVLGATPVTWAVWDEFQAIYGGKTERPSFGAEPDHPVVNVSANDCDQFCVWLSNATGVKFTLPSSTEFEYAAREGGKVREFPWDGGFDNTKLWCSVVQKRSGTAPVKRDSNIFKNELGLSDMAGNVWQWCSDGSDSFSRYIKGGSWYNFNAVLFRCASRYRDNPDGRYDNYGFRLSSPGLR